MAGYEFDQVEVQAKPCASPAASSGSTRARAMDSSSPTIRGQTDLKDVLLHVTSLRNSGREHALEGSIDRLRRRAPPQGLAGAPRSWRWTRAPRRRPTERRHRRRGRLPPQRRDGVPAARGFASRAAPRRRPAAAGARQGQVVQPHQGLRLRGPRRRARRHLRPYRDPAPIGHGRPAAGEDVMVRFAEGPKGLVVAEIEVLRSGLKLALPPMAAPPEG